MTGWVINNFSSFKASPINEMALSDSTALIPRQTSNTTAKLHSSHLHSVHGHSFNSTALRIRLEIMTNLQFQNEAWWRNLFVLR